MGEESIGSGSASVVSYLLWSYGSALCCVAVSCVCVCVFGILEWLAMFVLLV
jgi:hypothetical protein